MADPTKQTDAPEQPESKPSGSPERPSRLPQLLVVLTIVTIGGLVALKASHNAKTEEGPTEAEQAIVELEEQAREEQQSQIDEVEEQAPDVGEQAPDFTVEGEDGEIKLSDYEGKPVVVEFIATWCPHCANMAPRFAEVMGNRDDVEYLTVGVAGEPLKKVLKWHKTALGKPMPGQPAIDKSGEAREAYGVTGTPTTAFISADGELVDLVAGEMDVSELARKVDKLANS